MHLRPEIAWKDNPTVFTMSRRRWMGAGILILIAGLLGLWLIQSAVDANHLALQEWLSPGLIQRPLTELTLILQSAWSQTYIDAPPFIKTLPQLLAGSLCLALVFRLGSDLFGRATGWLAVWLLAMLAVPGLVGLPYLAVIAMTLGLHLVFFRADQHQRPVGWIYFLLAIAAVYSYTPLVYLIGLHGFWLWTNARLKRQSVYFYGLIGLALIPRLLFLPSELAFWQGVETAQKFLPVGVNPFHVAQYVVLFGGAGLSLLDNQARRVQELLLVFIVVFGIQLLLPASLILNLLTAVPVLALLAARGLIFLARPVRVILAVGFALPLLLPGTLNLWSSSREPVLTVDLRPDSRVVFSAPAVWQHLFMLDNLRSTAALIPPANRFHLLANTADAAVLDQTASAADAVAVQQLADFRGDSQDIWWLNMDSLPAAQDFLTQLEKLYAPFKVWTWFDSETDSAATLTLTHYWRIPDDLRDTYVYNQQLVLMNWQLNDSVVVQPCQTVTFQSWWRVTKTAPATVSTTLVLVGADGQGITWADGMPGYLEAPLWQVDRPYPDQRGLTIPCDSAPGEYPLLLGVYQFVGAATHNLPVTLPDGTPLGELAYLTTLTVP
ncbi:MAG TPA: hypothetical protein VHO69_19315 [Phototrophicaceae bacterium]|nr:hypothetical protein [Phototrophicaceae bacterium]